MKNMTLFCFIIFALLQFPLQADPWGKDADLSFYCPEQKESASPKCKTPFLGFLAEKLIKFHQNVISPCDGPRSHYIPSSSQYALEAMQKYDFLTGLGMGCDRLIRENKEEWVYRTTVDGAGKPIKYDPVP